MLCCSHFLSVQDKQKSDFSSIVFVINALFSILPSILSHLCNNHPNIRVPPRKQAHTPKILYFYKYYINIYDEKGEDGSEKGRELPFSSLPPPPCPI